MRNIIRLNAGKKIKLFSEVFTNNIFEYSFVLFISNQSLHTNNNIDKNVQFSKVILLFIKVVIFLDHPSSKNFSLVLG